MADVRPAEIVEVDTRTTEPGKPPIIAPFAGKIDEQIEALANVADDQEGRPPLFRAEAAGIAFRLIARAAHQSLTTAAPVAPALLGFEDEASTAIEIDPADPLAPVLSCPPHGTFEHIIVARVGCPRRIGPRQAQQIDQFDKEHGIVRPFRPAFPIAPSRDEGCHPM